MRTGGLPLGLAHGIRLKREVAAHGQLGWDDVDYDAADFAVVFRKEMERTFGTT